MTETAPRAVLATEAPFERSKLIYTRTDEAGGVDAVNLFFEHINGYSWAEIDGGPLKIIRHPDMPVALFDLIWTRLKAGKMAIAYIKNCAKDGRFYWILTAITPIKGGYVSVQMKPGMEFRAKVEAEYEAILNAETKAGPDDRLTPEDAAKRLEERVMRHGYSSYDAFAAEALTREVIARHTELGGTESPRLPYFLSMIESMRGIRAEASALSELFERLRTTPVNMGVLASRLEASGGPISAISGVYGGMSNEIGSWVKDFINDQSGLFASVDKAIVDGMARVAVGELQAELIESFTTEPDARGDLQAQTFVLSSQSHKHDMEIDTALRRIRDGASRLTSMTRDLKRHVTGLGATRMMCKVEGARLSRRSDSLTGVVAQLERFQTEVDARQATIDRLSQQLQRDATHSVKQRRISA